MNPRPFFLERYFARHEFRTPLLLASSDCESLGLAELLAVANEQDAAAWRDLKLGYTESAGLPELRECIAQDYDSVRADDVIVAAPQEALYLTMRSLLRPGDHVVATFPGYQSLYELAATIGCRVDRWQPEDTPDHWHFDPERLATLIRPDTRAIIVNFPHNPTGALPTPGEWAHIIQAAERCGAYLFSDEMYRGLESDRSHCLTPAVSAMAKGISLSGLSKAYGLPGLRMGWVTTRDASVLASIQAYRDYTTICSSAPSERLAVIALKNSGALISRCRGIIASNLPLVEAFMERHPAWFSWKRPVAGPIAFPALRSAGALQFCETLAEQAGVMLLPSTVYEWGDAHVRIGFGRTNLPVALAALERYLTDTRH